MDLLRPDRLLSLAAAAVAAPSADNEHVFRLAAQGDRLLLWATPDLANAERARRILGLISVGAVAENLTLRARRLGMRLEPRWQLDRGAGAPLAEFHVGEAPLADDPLERAIEQRHTNRRLRFRGPALAPPDQRAIEEDAASAGASLAWLDEPPRRAQALRLIRLAETERFRNPALHRELFGSIRFDVGWRASAERGLPPASLELPAFERPAFALLRHWGVQRIANLAGTHRFIGFRAAYVPCRLAPHLCAITADGDPEAAAVAAGRALQRVWLRASGLGLAFQVFAASALYALPGMDDIPATLARELAEGWERMLPGRRPYVVFRMGRADPVTARTGRPPPETVLAGAGGT